MKIAYLTSLYPAVSHTFVLREVQSLRARGHEIATFSIRKPAPQDIRGAEAEAEARGTRWLIPAVLASYMGAIFWAVATRPVETLRNFAGAVGATGLSIRDRLSWAIYFVEAVQLAHWLVREKFEHLHCHFGNTGSNTGMLAAELAGIPFSITCHGSELNEPEKFRLEDKATRAKFIVCVSKFGRARLMHISPPELWGKFHVVRCGVDGIEASPLVPHEGPGRIVCVARMSAEKGHLVLLDSLALLKERGVSFACTLVGDGPLRAAIEKRSHELGLDNALTMTGSLEPARVAEEFQRCDVAVLASFSEGVPVVLMEAMAHGRPVVATRVGGVAELVEHGKSGFVVSPGDVAELADALAKLLTDPRLARQMGDAGVGTVGHEFSIPRSAELLERLFEGRP